MSQKKRGFTLVELLLVIAIIGILAAVLFVGMGNQRERARVTSFKESLRGLVTTFTSCIDGSGQLYVGNLDGTMPACECPAGGCTYGNTGNVPRVSQCNDSTTVVSISATQRSGPDWSFSSTCNRSGTGGGCTATCHLGGCTFAGVCD